MKRCFILLIISSIFVASCFGCGREDSPRFEGSQKPIENMKDEQLPDNDEGNAGIETPSDTAVENGESSQEQEEVIVKEPFRMEICLEISAGLESGEIQYKDFLEGIQGPNSFVVRDGKFYILDTYNERILIYEGPVLEGSIAINECYNAMNFVVYKNNFYVLNSDDVIYEYNPEGVVVSEYALPAEKSYYEVMTMRVNDERKVVINFLDGTAYFIKNGEWILYNEESITQKSMETVQEFAYKGFSWFISVNNDGRNCIGVDIENSIYVDRLIFQNYDRQIEKYDSDGNLVGWANIDASNWFTMIPQKSIHVTQEGDIFLMSCLEDKVVIMQIFLGNMD